MASLSMQELAAQYGYVAAFFQQDPELKSLIQQAVAGQWSVQKFQAKFMTTQWYRSHEASSRQWQDLVTRDPAEAQAKISDKRVEIANQLYQLGVTMSWDDLTWTATSALREGWTDAGMKSMLATFMNYHPGHAAGAPATLEAQIKGLANDYGLQATDAQLTDWVTGMVAGRYTEDNVRSYFRDAAKSRYQGMSAQLDQGMTVKQVAGEYLNSYSRLLEVDPGTVDLQDNLIQQALQGTPSAPDKPPQMQTLYQFEQSLRRDPRWTRTKNAKDSITSAGQNVLRDWGLVG